MTQKLKTIIFATALTALAACSDDVATGQFTVGDDDNLVRLSTGVQSAPSTALPSRALDGHYALQDGTAINLYVEGDWIGKTPSTIKKTPVYSAKKDTDADNINAISWKSGDRLYWDDFGTADPDNTANRTKGLGILAVAIDGIEGTSIVNLGGLINWATFKVDCDLESNKGTFEVGGKKFLKQDILIANNLYDEANVTSPQKRYTFDEQKNLASNPEEARLDFKHVLSKITFNVTAGNGFNGTFLYEPNITLTRNKTGETNSEWCYKKGTINIKTATASHDGTLGTVELNTITSSSGNFTESAVIYPGSNFGSDNYIIARINADFNIYYITAAQIRAAIDALGASHEHSGNYTTLAGYHYIFNVTLNKTDIVVTATITDWNTINATGEGEIKFNSNIVSSGVTNDITSGSFEIFRGIALEESGFTEVTKAEYNAGKWALTPQIYWTNGTLHYYFRGLATTTDGTTPIATSEKAATQDVDLLWATTPAHEGTLEGGGTRHFDAGEAIPPRTGDVPLQFEHAMSKITVNLSTSTTGKATPTADESARAVDLGNVTVTISNIATAGTIAITDGNIAPTAIAAAVPEAVTGTTPATVDYTAPIKAIDGTIVIPQSLVNDTYPIKLTIKLSDGTTYSLPLKDCKVSGSETNIETWNRGNHYVYNIYVEKEAIRFVAVLKNWVEVNGGGNANLDWD